MNGGNHMSISRTRLTAIAWALALLLLAGIPLAAMQPQQAWADDGQLAAGGIASVDAQAKSKDYESPDGLVKVTGIKSGTVKYDQESRTLTIDNLKAKGITFYGDESFKLVLNGASKASIEDEDYESAPGKEVEGGASVTVSGKGKVSGAVDIDGDLTLLGGQVGAKKYKAEDDDAAIECGKLTVNGGKVLLDTCDGTGIECSGLSLVKGSVTVRDQHVGDENDAAIYIEDGDLKVSGGKLSVTKCRGTAVRVKGYTTGGKTYRGRTTPVVRHGGNALITGGSVALSTSGQTQWVYGLVCYYDVVAKGGNLSVKASRAFKKNSSGDVYGINCDEMSVCGGKVSASASNADSSDYSAYGVSCSRLTVSKGSLTAKAVGKKKAKSYGVRCYDGAAKVTGGTLDVSSSSSNYCRGIYSDKYIQTGGKASVKAVGKSTADARGIYCDSAVRVAKGSLKVNVSSSKRGFF